MKFHIQQIVNGIRVSYFYEAFINNAFMFMTDSKYHIVMLIENRLVRIVLP